MPQIRPPSIPGAVYHIYNRGSHRLSIFQEPANYIFILQKLKHYLLELQLTMLCYCLMPNHYHFLVRQIGAIPVGMLPQRVFNSYSKAYNQRYQHSGTLFEGPYRIKQVVQTTHMLQLCRYIHANPVKDGLVASPNDWAYSNYLEWIGQRKGTLVDHDFIQANFTDTLEYVEFVADYLRTRRLADEVTAYLRKIEQ